VSVMAFFTTFFAVRGVEGPAQGSAGPESPTPDHDPRRARFGEALKQVWGEGAARRFTIFVFVSMLAYSAQDLILEPFAGTVFGFSPGASTRLSGIQHGGVLLGMILVAVSGLAAGRWPGAPFASSLGSLRAWTVGGCIGSAAAMGALTFAGLIGGAWPLRETVFLLGVANGAFSIGAIGSMMQLAAQGREAREGTRMGLWGAAQAVAFGLGGLLGTGASDLSHFLIAETGIAYALVFGLEGCLFIVSAAMAWKVGRAPGRSASQRIVRAESGSSVATL